MFAHDVGCELPERAAGHAVSFVDKVELTGYRPRKRQLLLDEKNGDTGFAIQPQDDVANLVNDIRLNAFRGLVENEQLRLERQRPPDRQLLLLPAGQITAPPAPSRP